MIGAMAEAGAALREPAHDRVRRARARVRGEQARHVERGRHEGARAAPREGRRREGPGLPRRPRVSRERRARPLRGDGRAVARRARARARRRDDRRVLGGGRGLLLHAEGRRVAHHALEGSVRQRRAERRVDGLSRAPAPGRAGRCKIHGPRREGAPAARARRRWRTPSGYGQTLCELDRLVRGSVDVVLVGARDDARTKALADAVFARWLPNRTVAWLDPSNDGLTRRVRAARRGQGAEGARPSPTSAAAEPARSRSRRPRSSARCSIERSYLRTPRCRGSCCSSGAAHAAADGRQGLATHSLDRGRCSGRARRGRARRRRARARTARCARSARSCRP